MKLTVTQENLSRALGLVGRVAGGSRTSLPVLQNVMLSAENNQLRLSATNLEIAISMNIGAKVSKPGSITIPARLSQDFIASLPSAPIDLKLEGNQLGVSTDNYQSTINGVPADEFPALPAVASANQFAISSALLKKAIQQVLIAASHDETRPVLTGLWLHTHQKDLYLVATDSYRLAEKKVMPLDQAVDLLIPVTAMQDVLRIVTDSEEDVLVQYDEQQVSFKVDDIELTSRLIEGKYPDYRQLIPKSTAVKATLSRQDLISITKVSSLFARESAGSVALQVSEENQTVGIRSVASQVGENKAEAAAEVVGDIEVSLNSRYLLDALGVMSEAKVVFACDGKTNPCVLQPDVPAKDQDYKHIIMPLRS